MTHISCYAYKITTILEMAIHYEALRIISGHKFECGLQLEMM